MNRPGSGPNYRRLACLRLNGKWIQRNTLEEIAPYYKDLSRSMELFANFKPEGPYYTNRGKEKVTMNFINCREKKLNSEH
ncbi:MAG: hypothetical protein KJO53_13085 [Eudoraea sp.]|nr:hypothetical protein [Eudoraea sp.]MBT8291831.1 hypothetical protein [Eudoraea sp.]NNL01884.1 hypothetical protein [Eudoraea sp.]